jgi:hypothetical protein
MMVVGGRSRAWRAKEKPVYELEPLAGNINSLFASGPGFGANFGVFTVSIINY